MPEVQLGYALSSEETTPADLVRNARRAEEVGFSFAMISDHFHPWTDQQGQSPYAWSMLGAIAASTQRLQLGTGVTCPTVRYNPAIVAQAAATVACLAPGRFFLGVGSGEALNEHIMGEPWPRAEVRQEMMAEAVDLMRTLWQGGWQDFDGNFYSVDRARLYTLPEQTVPVYVAAAGTDSAQLAGEIGDGLVTTAPIKEVVQTFRQAGGQGKPMVGQSSVCWAATEQEGRKTALKWWPNAGVPGELSQELPMPAHFEQASKLVTEETIGKSIVCGPDPEQHWQKIQAFIDLGFTHVLVHQVGPDQEGFFRFYQQHILPRLK